MYSLCLNSLLKLGTIRWLHLSLLLKQHQLALNPLNKCKQRYDLSPGPFLRRNKICNLPGLVQQKLFFGFLSSCNCTSTKICTLMPFPFDYVRSRSNEVRLHLQAGRSSYISPDHLVSIPDPGAMAAAAWYRAAALSVKNKLHASES